MGVLERVGSLSTVQLLGLSFLVIVAVVGGAFALGFGGDLQALLDSRGFFVTVLAAFVLLMALLDWRRQ